MRRQKEYYIWPFILLVLSACGTKTVVTADSGGVNLGAGPTPFPAAALQAATWSPNVSGVSDGNKKGTITFSEANIDVSAPLLRLDDPWAASKEVSVPLGTFAQSDFGQTGSLSLTATIKNYPIAGGAYPVLISLSVDTGSGIIEYVNTKRAGTSSDCRASGMYACNETSCTTNPSCTVQSPSSFTSRSDWDQHQISSFGFVSVNTFPRCESTTGPWDTTTCPASMAGPLPAGEYTAKYVLLSDQSASVSGYSATLSVNRIIKKDATARDSQSTNGAIDLNVILVGSKNISDSLTAKGAQNLNLLFGEVQTILNAGAGVKISSIRAYEWDDDQFQDCDYTNIPDLFGQGSQGVDAEHQDRAINVFLVSSIPYADSGFTILGIAGGIGGSPIIGTAASGLAFSSLDDLAIFNPSCNGAGACNRGDQEDAFLEMGATIAHELGHYLGLNHPSERGSSNATQRHDQLTDTPKCRMRTSGATQILDNKSCIQDVTNTLDGLTCDDACPNYFVGNVPTNYCSAAEACQFNHIMWYTTKNRTLASGTWHEDGNMISTQSKSLVLWSPLVQ